MYKINLILIIIIINFLLIICGLMFITSNNYKIAVEIPVIKESIVEKPIYIEKPIEVIKQIPTVDFITYINPQVDPNVKKLISKSIDKYSKIYNIPRKLIISIMFKESSFNIKSTSKSGAIGLMQIIPKYHPKKVKGYKISELYYIDNNIKIGCNIFKEYFDKNKGDLDKTFHCYLSKNASIDAKNKYKNSIFNTLVDLTMYEYKKLL